MLKKRELLTSAMIEESDKNDDLLGRNKDAGHIIGLIADADGFDGHTSKKGISRLLYVEEPPKSQQNRPDRTQDRGETYGSGRWERLRLGRASFHRSEAIFVHDGLVNGFGADWGRSFQAEELVLISFREFLTRAVTLNLPWPDGKVPPAISMEIVWLSQVGEPLIIRPIDPSATKLGGPQKSENRNLESTCSLPRHKADELYALQVRGVSPGEEALFVFEVSQEELAPEGGNEDYCGFPVRLLTAHKSKIIIKDHDGSPFQFYGAKGSFAFFAISFPADWDFVDLFEIDPQREKWTRLELENFVRSLRKKQFEYPGAIRLGWYGYRVE